MEELLNKVEELNANIPDGIVKDADTILVDMVQENDFETTGIAQDILEFRTDNIFSNEIALELAKGNIIEAKRREE